MRDTELFDWYQRYSALKEFIPQYIRKGDTILVSGCGNSRLSEELYDDGFLNVINIDISKTVIAAMAARTADKKGMTWQVMNCTALAFADATMDAVLDKGTLDSLLCGENSTANVSHTCAEVSRVLRPGGNFIIVSYGTPENRLSYLENDAYKWRVTVHTIAKPAITGGAPVDADDEKRNPFHYLYVCHKM